jgi:hypothetical protein
VDPDWARACRSLERDLLGAVRRVPTWSLASTTIGADGLPEGFAVHTSALARLLRARVEAGAATPTHRRRRGARPAPSGAFAPLVLDASVVLDRRLRGGVRPGRRFASSGRRVLRADRLVTDPARRAFERPAKRRGGIVVVDQSGSMSLSNDELEALVARAPGALVVGYSHAPGSTGVPNAWILACGGRAATRLRAGNVGNGVDGPVLRFALSRRRGREPLIWICDGQVTDSGDHADQQLAMECARLVARHGIVMVASVREAIEAIGRRAALSGRAVALGRVAVAISTT